MDEQLYEIQDGVRRAEATWLCGHKTVAAQSDGLGDIIQVPVAALRSPKSRIEDNGPRGASWGVIYRRTKRGQELPSIAVVPGSRGILIADVEVAEDELELFRQRYSGNP